MKAMFEDYGEPGGEGAALAMRLMPGRSPGVVRLYEGEPHVFLWMPLF